LPGERGTMASMAEKAPTRCRWLKFSLTPLFAILALVAIVSLGRSSLLPSFFTAQRAVAEESKPADAHYRIAGICYLLERAEDEDGNRQIVKTLLPNAQVTLYVVHGAPDAIEEVAVTKSNDEGNFQFTGLAPPIVEPRVKRRLYGLVAHAEGYPTSIVSVSERIDPQALSVRVQAKSETLSGRLANADGEPLAGAIVAQYGIHGCPVPGVQSAVTNKIGRFRIEDLPFVDSGPPGGVTFRIIHPDYPTARLTVPSLPAETVFRLTAGCAVTGTVIDEVTGKPAAGVAVTAQHNKDVRDDTHVVTDEMGRYRMLVADGRYNIVAETEDRVCIAIPDHRCRSGETIELPPIKLTQGGWIEGRVLNAVTGEPNVTWRSGDRITVGLFGPANPAPARNSIILRRHLDEVDNQGRFKLRAAAGANYPYLVNEQDKRTAWDSMNHPAVVVNDGETVQYDMFVEPEIPPAEKRRAAR
jgi:hypothetical protein